MARTLEQIISELNPTFQPQVQSLQDQANLIPDQINSQEQGLNAKKDVAYQDIVDGARRRGLGFSGIPLGEQAKYAATDYAPALANLRQQGQQRAYSLQDAILGVNERRDTLGQQIYQQEQDRAAQEAARAAAAASAAYPTFGYGSSDGGGSAGGNPALPQITKGANGYQFTDPYGKPINAAEYVQLYNAQGGQIGYRELLSKMAADGDKNAQIALQYVGNDAKFGNAPTQYQGSLQALGASGSYAPTPQAQQKIQQVRSNLDQALLFSNPTQYLANKVIGR